MIYGKLERLGAGRHRGFTLLEALIALVIFSVALLGLAGMYTKTLSLSHSSYLRSLASIYARDLEERIYANPRADQLKYNTPGDPDEYAFSCTAAMFAASVPSVPDNTDPDTLAGLDRQAWCSLLGTAFGSGITAATVVASSRYDAALENPSGATSMVPEDDDEVPVEYTITLQWNERGLDSDNDQAIQSQGFVYTVRR